MSNDLFFHWNGYSCSEDNGHLSIIKYQFGGHFVRSVRRRFTGHANSVHSLDFSLRFDFENFEFEFETRISNAMASTRKSLGKTVSRGSV